MAKRLIVIYHDDFKEHSPGLVSHPERPERLDIALRSLTDIMSYVPSRRIVVKKAPRGGIDVFKRVHANAYVEQVKAILKSHRFDWLDKDTYVSKGTIKAISRLSGASRKAVMLALRGVNSFILGRPPSHHVGRSGRAMKAPSMGFCLLNTTALIASILAVHGRVTVVDFDAHHGNGTQEIFYTNPHILHIDIHVDPSISYPGTGYPEDVGEGEGAGTKVNIVTPHMAGDDIYNDALNLLEVLISSWKPDYVVVSAGFDAYRGDNEMVLLNIGTRFYYNIGRILTSNAKAVISVLEGGYGAGLDRAFKAYVMGILGLRNQFWDPPSYSSSIAWRMYKAYKRLTIANILKYNKINLPEEIAREVGTLEPRIRRYRRRKRKYKRYI